MRLGALGLAGALCGLGGCIPSNVVAVEDRRVVDDLGTVAWGPVARDDLRGLFHAIHLDGPLAGVLRSISYWFDADGTFTAAALFAGPPPSYRVLDGTWELAADGRLQLGAGAEPADVARSDDLLRLSGADGIVVLQRGVER